MKCAKAVRALLGGADSILLNPTKIRTAYTQYLDDHIGHLELERGSHNMGSICRPRNPGARMLLAAIAVRLYTRCELSANSERLRKVIM